MQLLVSESGVRGQIQDVTLATLRDLVREITAHDIGKGLYHFKYGGSLAGTEVPGFDAGLVLAEVLERDFVALGEIENVDVIADCGAVLGGIV